VTTYYAEKSGFVSWLSGLTGRSVFVPAATATGAWVRRLAGESPDVPALERARAAQSAKGFLMPAAEAVARYGQGEAKAVAVAAEPVVLVGVRACELRAWRYLDKVMLGGEFEDPMYRARREGAAIVSCDCVECAESCCCVLVAGRPFVAEDDGADINVTAIDGGFIVEVFTETGKELLASGANWPAATSGQLAKRQAARDATVEQLKKQNAPYSYAATDEAPVPLPEGDDEAWQRHAADCVECGACTHICPTCYCFYLYDHRLAEKVAERVRAWDSCLLSTYHRMAGGPQMKLTPRPELRSRLANRVLHKFVYSHQQYELLGCVGCGRCIDACPGAIDIRNVVEDLKQ